MRMLRKPRKYYIYSWPRRFDVTPKDMSKTVYGFDGLGDALDYATEMFKGMDSSIFWCVVKTDKVAYECMKQMVDVEFGRPCATLVEVHDNFKKKQLKKYRNKEDGDFE